MHILTIDRPDAQVRSFPTFYEGRFLGNLVRPLLDGARILQMLGVDPAEPVALQRRGVEHYDLTSTVGYAASRTTYDPKDGKQTIHFRKYYPYVKESDT